MRQSDGVLGVRLESVLKIAVPEGHCEAEICRPKSQHSLTSPYRYR